MTLSMWLPSERSRSNDGNRRDRGGEGKEGKRKERESEDLSTHNKKERTPRRSPTPPKTRGEEENKRTHEDGDTSVIPKRGQGDRAEGEEEEGSETSSPESDSVLSQRLEEELGRRGSAGDPGTTNTPEIQALIDAAVARQVAETEKRLTNLQNTVSKRDKELGRKKRQIEAAKAEAELQAGIAKKKRAIAAENMCVWTDRVAGLQKVRNQKALEARVMKDKLKKERDKVDELERKEEEAQKRKEEDEEARQQKESKDNRTRVPTIGGDRESTNSAGDPLRNDVPPPQGLRGPSSAEESLRNAVTRDPPLPGLGELIPIGGQSGDPTM